jgi:hypothetical protein
MSDTFELYNVGPGFTDGDMTVVLHDADGIENKVLHAGLANSIFARWHIEGPDVPLVNPAARWHLEAHFETIGPGDEFIEPDPVDVAWADGQLTPPNFMRWNGTIGIPAGTFPPGVYKAVVLISFQLPAAGGTWTETNMSGFYEIPMIRFTAQ